MRRSASIEVETFILLYTISRVETPHPFQYSLRLSNLLKYLDKLTSRCACLYTQFGRALFRARLLEQSWPGLSKPRNVC